MTSTVLFKIDPRDPDLARLRDVARASRQGKIVGFPTETVYGIGAPMSVSGVSEKLAEIKMDKAGSEFTYYIGEWEMVDYLQIIRTPSFRYVTRLFWPGPLTVISLNAAGQKIGMRFPKSLLASALINSTGEPFLAASAALSGHASPRTADEVMKTLEGKIDYLIDGGPCEVGEDSSIVDLSDETKPLILRAGPLGNDLETAVQKITSGKFPKKKILIVCTGNSCRSPMAEGWLKDELARRGLADEIEVSSCGVGTRPGMSASPEAVYVMKNREVDISTHRSRMCTREDIMNSDLILAMSQQHNIFITGMVPSAKAKMKVLNIIDPIGMSMSVYEDVMNVIEKKIKDLWPEITK